MFFKSVYFKLRLAFEMQRLVGAIISDSDFLKPSLFLADDLDVE